MENYKEHLGKCKGVLHEIIVGVYTKTLETYILSYRVRNHERY